MGFHPERCTTGFFFIEQESQPMRAGERFAVSAGQSPGEIYQRDDTIDAGYLLGYRRKGAADQEKTKRESCVCPVGLKHNILLICVTAQTSGAFYHVCVKLRADWFKSPVL